MNTGNQLSRMLLAVRLGCILAGISLPLAGAAQGADALVVGEGSGSPLAHVHAISAAKGFSEPGLTIKWMRFPTGAALSEGMAAGKIQVGIAGDTPAMALIAGGTPAKIISLHADSTSALALYARKDANINRPEDLYGKTVGLTFGSQAQALWISIAEANGLDLGKVKTVSLPPSGLQAAYERGEIDAYVLWQPPAYVLSRIRPTVRLEDPDGSYFPAQSGPKKLHGYYTVIIARDDAIRTDAASIEAFLRLVDKTNKFITANPAESAAIIAKDLKVEVEGPEIVLKQTKHDMAVSEASVKDLEAQANLLFKLGRLRNKPPADLKGWLDLSLLKKVFPDYVKVQ